MRPRVLFFLITDHWPFLLAALLMAALWPAGCSDNAADRAKATAGATVESPKRPPPPPPAAAPATASNESPSATSVAPEPAPASPQPQPTPQPTPTPQPAPSSPPPSGPTDAERPVQLTRGQSLEQTTVEGNAVAFSVEYQLTGGAPDPAGCVWVIERARGNPERQKVKLDRQGKLETVLVGWRSEQGPFHCHLEDADGKQVSESVEMPQYGG